MRILHVVGRSHRRGAEMVAMELAHELDLLGHENSVVALCLAQDGGRDPALEPLVERVDLGPVTVILSAFALRKRLRAGPVDVVLAHGGWAVQVVTLAARRGGPLIVWQRILNLSASEWRVTRRWWWRQVVSRIDAAVALTPSLEQETRRAGFDGPIWLIPNSRRPDRFVSLDRVAESRWLRGEIGVGPDVELIGFVGHLVDQKRPERAVEVLRLLRERGRDVHLVMAGGGPLAGSVQREVAAADLHEHVTMLGHRNDVERVFGGVDVVLLTSDNEGIPGVAIEAQMSGCPVVSFPLGGVSDVVEDDVTGIVLKEFDTGVMADAVGSLLGDRERLTRMGTRARDRTEDFAASTTARTYAERIASLRSDLVP